MPEHDADEEAGRELTDVLLRRLGPEGDTPIPQAAQAALEALRTFRSRRSTRRRGTQSLDPQLVALFDLIAIEPADLERLTPEIAGFVERGLERGLPREAVPAVFQAYVRAVGRVVAAEVAATTQVLAETPAQERARVLDDVLEDITAIGTRGFDLLHRMLLLDAMALALDEVGDPAVDTDVMAIAMVDLVGSTEHLAQTEPAELERLVDALFEAGQAATAQRPTHVVKYVGDGLFLAGRDVPDVADAALEVIERLEETLPLRARGGLAHGTVVQRAGDLFGIPINLAHITSKAARPGTLLATAEAAELLPQGRRGRSLTMSLPHPAVAKARVARVRPPGEPA